MPSLTEQAKKLSERNLKREEARKKQAEKDRASDLRHRRALNAIKIKQRDLLGETIRDADLTPQEHVVIAKILARRAAPLPKDWEVLGDWLHAPAKVKAAPANSEPDELAQAAAE
jgi:hypothetical protein